MQIDNSWKPVASIIKNTYYIIKWSCLVNWLTDLINKKKRIERDKYKKCKRIRKKIINRNKFMSDREMEIKITISLQTKIRQTFVHTVNDNKLSNTTLL